MNGLRSARPCYVETVIPGIRVRDAFVAPADP